MEKLMMQKAKNGVCCASINDSDYKDCKLYNTRNL